MILSYSLVGRSAYRAIKNTHKRTRIPHVAYVETLLICIKLSHVLCARLISAGLGLTGVCWAIFGVLIKGWSYKELILLI